MELCKECLYNYCVFNLTVKRLAVCTQYLITCTGCAAIVCCLAVQNSVHYTKIWQYHLTPSGLIPKSSQPGNKEWNQTTPTGWWSCDLHNQSVLQNLCTYCEVVQSAGIPRSGDCGSGLPVQNAGEKNMLSLVAVQFPLLQNVSGSLEMWFPRFLPRLYQDSLPRLYQGSLPRSYQGSLPNTHVSYTSAALSQKIFHPVVAIETDRVQGGAVNLKVL